MSIIIFFSMALGIFALSVTVVSVTLYQWRKQSRLKKQKTDLHSQGVSS